MAPPGAPTISGKLQVLEGTDVLHAFFDIFTDTPEPLTGNGIAFEAGVLENAKFGPVELAFPDKEVSVFDLRAQAKHFEIVTHYTGFGKDDPVSVISFYAQGGFGFGTLIATAVVKPAFEIHTLQKGLIKWNLLEK
jgi:hypothetical protein